MTATYGIRAIDPIVVKQLLDRDDAGCSPRLSTDLEGGAPLRCCLRFSERGEAIALVAYEPLRRWAAQTGADPGPYDERGPVFVHAGQCPGTSDAVPYPRPRRRVCRAYAADGDILGGRLAEPHEAHADVLAEAFEDPAVALVHVRALEFGCFLYEARRTEARRNADERQAS
jgi:Protein of unknown function (DUF1203)